MKSVSTSLSSSTWLLGGSPRALALACVALSLGLAQPALAFRPVDGQWTGHSTPTRLYDFTVLAGGTVINPLFLQWSVCGGNQSTWNEDIPISASNTFSASKSYFGSCPTVTTNGAFTSTTTATGTLTVTYVRDAHCTCSGTETLTWTAAPKPPQVDVAVTKDDGKLWVVAGTSNVYTITATNNGPARLTSMTLRDTLPAGLVNPVFVPSSGTYNPFTGAWTGLDLAASQSAVLTLTVDVSPNAFGNLVNWANVQPPSGTGGDNPNNNQDGDSTVATAEADLAIAMTGPTLMTVPGSLTWRLAVTNNGPSDAQLVQVQDATPAGLTFVSNSGGCATPFPCNLATVPAGQTRTIDATFTVPADYAGPNPFSNTATLTTGTLDPNATNNTATATLQVVPPAPAARFYTIGPCRLVDTRASAGPHGGPALAAGADRTFVATGARCGVPATARAISVNVTATASTVAGNLRLYPADYPLPQASTVNYSAGQTRANNGVVALNGEGEFTIRCAQASGAAHAVVDVNGYFE